jgi:hypothetical protein
MRISKHARRASTIHALGSGVGVCLLALTRELLAAKEALSASDLEGGDVALPNLNTVLANAWADLLDDTTELVAEDVAFG